MKRAFEHRRRDDFIGLAAKNAILIVEFAKVRTDKGMDAKKAAVEAAGLRLRPIIMTSLAFGCLPLAIASGAGSAARNSMGTAVVSGMLAATQIASAEFRELNLDDCIDLALKNNRTIEQSVELRENAKWMLKRQRRATGLSINC